jgi:alpha-mannosidase
MATEQEIREELGIPDAAQRVILFSQSSHLDWDWLETFPTLCDDPNNPYFSYGSDPAKQPAFSIFDAAVALVTANQGQTPPYYYSVAEIGFLQAYAESTAARLQGLKDCGTFLHLCGGGITSPDNLLPHGEAFLRNFLVAQTWYAATLGLPVMNVWIPDDFGHDSQLQPRRAKPATRSRSTTIPTAICTGTAMRRRARAACRRHPRFSRPERRSSWSRVRPG